MRDGGEHELGKICIVVQRYGAEINGGAEQHARRIAERLVPKYEIEVITSTALELKTWQPYYSKGCSTLNGVKVTRFDSICRRNEEARMPYHRALQEASEQTRIVDENIVDDWLNGVGLVCPDMLEYIMAQKNQTDLFLFVTYLYYHTVRGLPLVADKAAFLPTAHDEPHIYFPHFEKIFNIPRYFLFNSAEECQLVHGAFRNEHIPYKVVGEGVDTPERTFPQAFKEKYSLDEYIIYVGRVSQAKKCDELIKYFIHYKQTYPSCLKLVLIGRSELDACPRDDVIFAGFVSDQEKFDAMAGAKLLAMPSPNESLCMAVLEALSVGTPILVNAECAVTKGHCLRSNGGLYYRNYWEFAACIQYMDEHRWLYEKMGENGKKYVSENYNWDITLEYIDEIMKERSVIH